MIKITPIITIANTNPNTQSCWFLIAMLYPLKKEIITTNITSDLMSRMGG